MVLEVGFHKVSVEAIAAKTSVGKSTTYHWWPNKVAVIMNAFIEQLSAAWRFPENESAVERLRLQDAENR